MLLITRSGPKLYPLSRIDEREREKDAVASRLVSQIRPDVCLFRRDPHTRVLVDGPRCFCGILEIVWRGRKGEGGCCVCSALPARPFDRWRALHRIDGVRLLIRPQAAVRCIKAYSVPASSMRMRRAYNLFTRDPMSTDTDRMTDDRDPRTKPSCLGSRTLVLRAATTVTIIGRAKKRTRATTPVLLVIPGLHYLAIIYHAPMFSHVHTTMHLAS